MDKEKMTISSPPWEIRELQELLEEWPKGRRTATVREVLVLAGKLHHVAYVIRPARSFIRRLLQLRKLPLDGLETREKEGAWGRSRKKAEATKVLRSTEEFMEDVGWWRLCLKEGMAGEGERLAAPFFR